MIIIPTKHFLMLNIKTTLNFLPKKVAVSKNFMVFTKSKL